MKFYYVAGERSGDLHGGNLIRSLKKRNPSLQCRGFGGDAMQSAGMALVVHYRELAFMGFIEVLANLLTIRKKIKQCKVDIEQYNPDAIVLIDYAGFNMRIARFAHARKIKVLWYISPKVWAWNQGRALKLKAYIDRMYVILPFEKEFFRKFDWEVEYVGNPVLDAVTNHSVNPGFCARHKIGDPQNLVALLPGSRRQELDNCIPVMAEVVRQFPALTFAVATVSNLPESVYQPLRLFPNVRFIEEETYDLLAHARAAVVTSGTATLETALFRVPQVVIYSTSAISYRIAKAVIQVSYISLVNLIAGKSVVRELIQQESTAENIGFELVQLLQDGTYRDTMLMQYESIVEQLTIGSASENAADRMLSFMRDQ
jgi:lipid-A-disaccharide synthase